MVSNESLLEKLAKEVIIANPESAQKILIKKLK